MYTLRHIKGYIVGWNIETGQHGFFTNTAQQAIFRTEEEAWNYMDLLERLGCDVRDVTVEEE